MADSIGVVGPASQAAPAANGTLTTSAGVTTQASGSVFLVYVGYGTSVGPNATTPVTDNKSNTYTKLGGIATDATHIGGEWYYSSNAGPAGGAAHTWTIKIGGTGGDVGIVALEVLGLTQTADQSGNTLFNQLTSGVTSENTVAETTTNADDIIVAGGENSGDAAQTQAFSAVQGGGTWTIPTNGSNNGTTFSPLAIAYQLLEATATMQAGYNTGAAVQQHWTTGNVSFKASVAAGAAPPRRRALMGVGV